MIYLATKQTKKLRTSIYRDLLYLFLDKMLHGNIKTLYVIIHEYFLILNMNILSFIMLIFEERFPLTLYYEESSLDILCLN